MQNVDPLWRRYLMEWADGQHSVGPWRILKKNKIQVLQKMIVLKKAILRNSTIIRPRVLEKFLKIVSEKFLGPWKIYFQKFHFFSPHPSNYLVIRSLEYAINIHQFFLWFIEKYSKNIPRYWITGSLKYISNNTRLLIYGPSKTALKK